MQANLKGKKWMFLEALTKLVLEKAIERVELRQLPFDADEENGRGEDGQDSSKGGHGKRTTATAQSGNKKNFFF